VQVPAQPVHRAGALGDEVIAPVGEQLQLTGGRIVRGDREHRFAQDCAGHGEGVDRVGFAPRAGR
jgi:hypothetical protein